MNVEACCLREVSGVGDMPSVGRIAKIIDFMVRWLEIVEYHLHQCRIKHLKPATFACLSIRYCDEADSPWTKEATNLPDRRAKTRRVVFLLCAVGGIEQSIIQADVLNCRYAYNCVK